ncbi:hypothetical protein [Streptomyces sp. NPDC057696]|uniref:hypothetical protein n=1 Tax=Streptomyces sp. NPDC057696 TaxID=3346218 RepID=UPI0036AA2007
MRGSVPPASRTSPSAAKDAASRPVLLRVKWGEPAVRSSTGCSSGRRRDSYLGVFFRRLAARRGGRRALVAVMHKLAIAIWHVLHDKTVYRELGPDHFTRRGPERAMRRMLKEANNLGLTVRFEPITA